MEVEEEEDEDQDIEDVSDLSHGMFKKINIRIPKTLYY